MALAGCKNARGTDQTDPSGLRTEVCCRPLRGFFGRLSGKNHCYVRITSDDNPKDVHTYGLHRLVVVVWTVSYHPLLEFKGGIGISDSVFFLIRGTTLSWGICHYGRRGNIGLLFAGCPLAFWTWCCVYREEPTPRVQSLLHYQLP